MKVIVVFRKISVLAIVAVVLVYPSPAYGLWYWVTAWDKYGDPYNFSQYGYQGISAEIYVFSPYVPYNKVGSVNAKGDPGRGWQPRPNPPYYAGPDFAEVGWTKEYNGAPKHFVAWADADRYGTVDLNDPIWYPAYHDYYVEYSGPSGDPREPYNWKGYVNGNLRLTVNNRNRYAAPQMNSERSNKDDDGYNAFGNIYVKWSDGTWHRPSFGPHEDNDTPPPNGYYFNPYTV